jgi:hypothetical protein
LKGRRCECVDEVIEAIVQATAYWSAGSPRKVVMISSPRGGEER